MTAPHPRARRTGILTEEIEGELLVYDQHSDQAHHLNGTAAAVWRHLDGRRTPADLVPLVAQVAGDVADEDLVMVALDELQAAGLLEDAAERHAVDRRMSRRAFIRRAGVVGAAAAALPVVHSIVAPTPAAAQSACRNCLCVIS